MPSDITSNIGLEDLALTDGLLERVWARISIGQHLYANC